MLLLFSSCVHAQFHHFIIISYDLFASILGSFTAATDMETLKQRNITHILTLDICPLPVHITEVPFLTTKFIHGLFICLCPSNAQLIFFSCFRFISIVIRFYSIFQCLIHRKTIYLAISKNVVILLRARWRMEKRYSFTGQSSSDTFQMKCDQFVIDFLLFPFGSYYGVSRSATIVIAYVMRKYKLSTTPAYER